MTKKEFWYLIWYMLWTRVDADTTISMKEHLKQKYAAEKEAMK